MAKKPKRSTVPKKPAKRTQTKLQLVRSWPSEDATILDLNHAAPWYLGEDREDLLCGACRVPLAMGVSAKTLRSLFDARERLLMRCPKCRSLSRLA